MLTWFVSALTCRTLYPHSPSVSRLMFDKESLWSPWEAPLLWRIQSHQESSAQCREAVRSWVCPTQTWTTSRPMQPLMWVVCSNPFCRCIWSPDLFMYVREENCENQLGKICFAPFFSSQVTCLKPWKYPWMWGTVASNGSGKNKPVEIYCDSKMSHMMLADVACDWFVLQFGNSGGPLINLVSHRSCFKCQHKWQQTCSDYCAVSCSNRQIVSSGSVLSVVTRYVNDN